MSKLSTKELKTMISLWLSDPKCKEDIKYYSDMTDLDELGPDWQSGETVTQIECARRLWGAPKHVNTPELLDEFIWKLWIDGSRWKRNKKCKIQEDEYGIFYNGEFLIDMIGECNDFLLKKYVTNQQLEKCIFREFVPDNELGNNYRLNVVTTPEDDEVIGWTVIVD
jgi:hypothetical protein